MSQILELKIVPQYLTSGGLDLTAWTNINIPDIEKIVIRGAAPCLDPSNEWYGYLVEIDSEYYIVSKFSPILEFPEPKQIGNIRLQAIRYSDATGQIITAYIPNASLLIYRR